MLMYVCGCGASLRVKWCSCPVANTPSSTVCARVAQFVLEKRTLVAAVQVACHSCHMNMLYVRIYTHIHTYKRLSVLLLVVAFTI